MCLFFKQKTAYEMRISDWSSDVCSSDLLEPLHRSGKTQADRVAADVLAVFDDGPARRPDVADRIAFGRENPCIEAVICVGPVKQGNIVAERHQIGRASCRERVWPNG